jgi:hypothetical protein
VLDLVPSPDPGQPGMGFAAARCWSGVTTFFCDVLEHLLVQEWLGHQSLEPLGLGHEFPAPAVGVDLGRVVALSLAMVSRLGDADLSANIQDRQRLGKVAVGVTEQSNYFVGAPSPSHESLLDTVYRRTPILGGPVFGEHPNRRQPPRHQTQTAETHHLGEATPSRWHSGLRTKE